MNNNMPILLNGVLIYFEWTIPLYMYLRYKYESDLVEYTKTINLNLKRVSSSKS